ncbi:MAG: helix-turn-helix transcriptional regulator [Chloroflexi bacterium]|nr:helix-turn-helix transcriptional regulator [Chloroflexota bacterium]
MKFGERIKELRKQKRITQRQLAESLNRDFTYISKIENDRLEVLPSEETIRNIARELKADPEELLDLAGKIDSRKLREIARETPEASAILRRIQSRKLTPEQLQEMKAIANKVDTEQSE